MNNIETIQNDLRQIIDTCYQLLSNSEQIFNTKYLDNRAYNVLLILKQNFEDELKQGEMLPF